MRRIALTLATSMAVFAPALAEEPPKVPPDVEVLFPRGAEACYSARFRKDALRSGQTLTEFYLYRLFEPDPRQEEVALPRERAMALDKTSDLEKTVDVLARFTDSPEAFSQTVLCTYAEYGKSPITCYVECDGGSLIKYRIFRTFQRRQLLSD
jgi:hypothetical protein